ncbi:MAG: N-acetyl-gamma-glutamyl-phosphate reductase [Chitinophagaceae bacterium]
MDRKNKIRAGIIGGAGYTGGEVIRILLFHPGVEIVFVHSRSHFNHFLSDFHQDLMGETSMRFSQEIQADIDVLFLCLGHGEARKFLAEHQVQSTIRVIDLSQDFRLGEKWGDREFVYGLPELQREKIRNAENIANPGCFATAIELGLLPLAKAGLLQSVHTTGITGSTGAGQKPQDTTHFTWRANNITAYKVLSHQHLNEISLHLRTLQPDFTLPLHFVPFRGDFPRGIWVTSYLDCSLNLKEAFELYHQFYENHPFTMVSEKEIHLKLVVNTNKCFLNLEKVGDQLIIHSIIDNLLKGASGQAVQNMNLIFGLPETTGLQMKSIVY